MSGSGNLSALAVIMLVRDVKDHIRGNEIRPGIFMPPPCRQALLPAPEIPIPWLL
jgi:hypothetical protein